MGLPPVANLKRFAQVAANRTQPGQWECQEAAAGEQHLHHDFNDQARRGRRRAQPWAARSFSCPPVYFISDTYKTNRGHANDFTTSWLGALVLGSTGLIRGGSGSIHLVMNETCVDGSIPATVRAHPGRLSAVSVLQSQSIL
jgi:hypothetical protein